MTLGVTTSNLSESSLPLGSFSTQYTTSDQQSVENSLKLSRQHEKPVENFSDFSANSSTNHSHNQPQTQEFSALPFMTQSIISTTMKPLQNVAALQQTEVPHPVGYIHSPTVPALSPVLPIPSRTANNNLASNSPVKTKQYETTGLPIILDGRSYEPEELISLIQRLRQDIRGYTDHIRWLEQELSQTRIALNARDRDIDKLKSVLDQKLHNNVSLLPTYPVTPLSDTSRQLIMHNKLNVTRVSPTSRVAGLSESVLQSPEKLRTKKQGVSGESFTEQRLSGLVHHDKDIWSADLIRDAISNNTFLKHLEQSQIEEIVSCMYKKQIPQGCFIIREGEPGDALYVVSDGILEVYKESTLIGRMEVGRAFGELALLYNCKRTASVRALTNASVWALDRRVFQKIMMATCLHKQEENMKFLKSVPALKDLSSEKMNKLADVLEPVFYEADEYIIREGELGETFFIIKSGKVRVTHTVEGTDETQEIRQLSDGDWFGERALYTCEKRSANVISAEGGVHLLLLDRSNFIYLIGDLNEFKSKTYDDVSRSPVGVISTSYQQSKGYVNKEETVSTSTTAQTILERQSKDSLSFTEIEKDDLEPITVLGVGGFGCVELVVWKKNRSKSFALKRMKKQHIVHTRQQEHICSERKIMMELRCPFICRLYCTYKDNKFVYMLLEACLGGELWTVLRNKGRFDDIVTRFVVACVLEAFTYLHTQGILYRDLKPENLLLDHKGYVKLCDFGFAKRVGHGKKTWTFCGTPEYVAPEIILNKGHDHSADYWSLGILIFELLTGSPPFTGTDPMKIYNVVLRGIDCVEFHPHHISRNASALIRRLCAQNPAERLGYGRCGIIDIKQNKYFQGFDWIGLHRGTLTAPIQPVVSYICIHQKKYLFAYRLFYLSIF
ncbi:cGMP-dependent protein kinase 1 isoform 1 [Schistosoma japonicum]|uniref:cGMP-dependent protein kinase 1 isoform 1 n=1 Tax=Schistosoma japonicum TaxID=6182 RepID=A0A4Z2CPT9_SCHJA|nr:cGMP-dependent protein kinase 1 isoform 1 [Schistosoma japonicum]